jgi:hypothetical protein
MDDRQCTHTAEELDAAAALILLSKPRESIQGREHYVIPSPMTYSDGIANYLPAGFVLLPTTHYRQKLAHQWMKRTNEAPDQVDYILDQLPEHYF